MTTPTLTVCETKPQLDGYHRDTSGETWSKFWIDPETGRYGISQEMDDNAQPADEYHGLTVACRLETRPDEDAAREYLQSPGALALVHRVIDGHSVTWDGHNNTGSLDDDASAALDEMLSDLAGLPDCDWSMYKTADYLDGDDCGVAAETTNEQIETLAESLESEATDKHVILADAVADHLYKIREEAQDSTVVSLASAARLTGLDASHLRRMIRTGKLTAQKPGHDWLIDVQDLRGILRIKPGRPRKTAA